VSEKRPCHLYRHYDKDDCLLYVGINFSAIERFSQHRGATWFKEITTLEIEEFPDRESAEFAETVAIKSEKPKFNIAKVDVSCMSEQDAQARGFSLTRFRQLKRAHERRQKEKEDLEKGIDFEAARRRLQAERDERRRGRTPRQTILIKMRQGEAMYRERLGL